MTKVTSQKNHAHKGILYGKGVVYEINEETEEGKHHLKLALEKELIVKGAKKVEK